MLTGRRSSIIQAAVAAHVAGRDERQCRGDASADLPVEGPAAGKLAWRGCVLRRWGSCCPLSVEVFQARFQGITFHLLSVLTSQDAVKGVWDAIACHWLPAHPSQEGVADHGCLGVLAAGQVHLPVHRDVASHEVPGAHGTATC